MSRKPKHHQRREKFEVTYPLDSGAALFYAIGSNGAETFKAAANGDQKATENAISDAILYLAVHRDTRMSIPRSLCDWLLKGLEAAAQGESMEVAMGMRRRGARNAWTLYEKKRAVTLLWTVRDYLKTRPPVCGQDYHEVTARWISDPVIPAELVGFTDARASTSWVSMADGRLPYKRVSVETLREWERQAVAVEVPAAQRLPMGVKVAN